MPSYVSREMQPARDLPVNVPGDAALGGRERRWRSTIRLNNLRLSPSSGTAVAGLLINDDVLLADVPPGYRFAGLEIVSTVSLGTTTINVGTSQTHASNTLLASGLTYTTPNALLAAQLGLRREDGPLTTTTRYFATFGVANVAASDNVITIDLIFVGP